MFIQTEETPNPNTLKFLPGQDVITSGSVDFPDEEAAKQSPLATALFDIADVKRVFFGSDFITVTKAPNVDWAVLKPAVLTTIMDHFVAGLPVMKKDATRGTKATTSNEEDDELVRTIKELIDTRVRPAVAQDGGDIIYVGFEDGIVKLELHGSCSGCPSSTATLKSGIENMLKHYVPEVMAVEAVNS